MSPENAILKLLTLAGIVCGLIWDSIWVLANCDIETSRSEEIEIVLKPLGDQGFSSVHCGLHSVLTAANAIGVELQIQDLLLGDYISSEQGSTIEDLMRAAVDFELGARKFTDIDTVVLQSFSYPTILQLNIGGISNSYHWVACLGTDATGAFILDSPNQLEHWTYEELEMPWTGHGIAIYNTGDPPPSRADMRIRTFLHKFCWIGIPVIVLLVGHRFGYKKTCAFSSVLKRLSFIGLAVCLWGVAVCFFQPNRTKVGGTVESISCWVSDSEFGANEINYVQSISKDDLLIDCRIKQSYLQNHIPGAISLPINLSFHDWIQKKDNLGDRRIVVYCQSAQCQWAAMTCRRLACYGIDSSVYVGGYDNFLRENYGK